MGPAALGAGPPFFRDNAEYGGPALQSELVPPYDLLTAHGTLQRLAVGRRPRLSFEEPRRVGLAALGAGPPFVRDNVEYGGPALQSELVPPYDYDGVAGSATLARVPGVGTDVKDLSPRRGMPTGSLGCQSSNVTDLTQIKDLPLKSLWLDFQPARDTALLRSMPTLEYINDKPVAEFWKDVEAIVK